MNRARLLWLVAGWLMLAPVAAASVPAQLEPAIRDRVIAAAVQVAITFEATENGVASEEYAPVGSGTVVSADGFILTNAHVVDPATHREQLQRWTRQADQDGKSLSFDLHEGRLVILFPDADGQPTPQYEAEVVERDSALDLAVLRIGAGEYGQPLPQGSLALPFVPLGDSDALAIGDPVDVFGYPGVGGDSLTYSSGIVSGFLKEDGIQGRAWIKSDASISGGSSGGTAIDRTGRLVGVPTPGASLDCRPGDTNGDGEIDGEDVGCCPTGGSIGQLRPVNLAKPILQRAGLAVSPNDTVAAAIPPANATEPAPQPAAPTATERPASAVDGPMGFDTEAYCSTSPNYVEGELLILSRAVEIYTWTYDLERIATIAPAGSRFPYSGMRQVGNCDRYVLDVDPLGILQERQWIDERLLRREGAPVAYPPPANMDTVDRFDCEDFETKADALAFFRANGGPLYDPSNLDPDGNGLICVGLP